MLAALLYATAYKSYLVLFGSVLLNISTIFIFMNLRAYLADTVDNRWLSRAIGIFSTAMGAGVTLGPLLGGLISESIGYRQSYLSASTLALLGMILGFFGLKKVEPERSLGSYSLTDQFSLLFSMLKKPRILWVGLMNVVNFTAFGMIMTYFPVLGEELGYTVEVIGFLFLIRGLATTVIRVPIGLTLSKFGEPAMMVITLALKIVGLTAISQTNNFEIIILLIVIQGITFGGYLTSSNSFLLRGAPSHERGITLGFVRIFQGLMVTISSYIVGFTAHTIGIKTSYLYMGLAMGGVTAIFIALAYVKPIFKETGQS
jgi:DHA1 family multidrug resistance protein-like MFS transporter